VPLSDRKLALKIHNLHSWYGDAHTLQGINLHVADGEIVTLLGRNGAGKSTTLKCVMGLVEKTSGQIILDGSDIREHSPEDIAYAGVAYCPEDRGIFSNLTVRENLYLPRVVSDGGMPLEKIFKLFPNLESRLQNMGSHLSGGEQQMLALARILRMGAKILLLDEPTEGLAPAIIQQIVNAVRALRQDGYTVLLIEQNLAVAVALGDRHYVLETGAIIDEMNRDGIVRQQQQLQSYLGV